MKKIFNFVKQQVKTGIPKRNKLTIDFNFK